jgi:hypothetical protein
MHKSSQKRNQTTTSIIAPKPYIYRFRQWLSNGSLGLIGLTVSDASSSKSGFHRNVLLNAQILLFSSQTECHLLQTNSD